MTVDRERALVRREHWLRKPENIRKLWRVFAAVLAATVLTQVLVPLHGEFGIDATLGFPALYGFLSCVVMVVFAKILGWWLSRPDDYYPEESLFLWTASVEPAPEWRDEERNEERDQELNEEGLDV